MADSSLVKIASLWRNQDKNGTVYLSGYLGDAKILIFQAKNKTSEKSPDYHVYVAQSERKPKPDKGGDDVPF